MFRLLFFFYCIYFTGHYSNVHSEILFRNRGSGTATAQKMCNKYTLRACNGTLKAVTTTTTTTTTTATTFAVDEHPLESTQAEENFEVHITVVGGKISAPKEYPHMVLIGYGEHSEVRWSCGGSLISEQFVLTAAHCANSNLGPATYVRLGELDLGSTTDEADSKDFPIIQIFAHPQYNSPILYNDIALLKFNGLASFNAFIRPTCLNIYQNFNALKLTAVGWGSTGYGEGTSPQLMDVELDLQDPDRCDQIYRGDRLPEGFNSETMICAGYTPGGKDTCQGDSGGPLQYLDTIAGCARTYVQVGVVSFGEGCASPDTPAIYTRVSYFIPWIESIVWK